MRIVRSLSLLGVLAALVLLGGCAKKAEESGVGESAISGGAGGEGSGPTGTGGAEPADNPAPNSNGTGGP